ncbi:MAG: FAD-dependent oxidoreductase [Bacteroidales bacterium]
MTVDVLIIGGGPAGLKSASLLESLGYKVVLIEKESAVGGHIKNWDRLFPDSIDAKEVLDTLIKNVSQSTIKTDKSVKFISKQKNSIYNTQLNSGETILSSALLLTTGFSLFPAQKKEEYGYGVYDGVITNADLESFFKKESKIEIENPSKIGFVHCVGSRDEKAGNKQCSKVCCITAVKQAIELKEMFPNAQIFCFYMDLRMFGRGYEDIYLKAQTEFGVRFIRGRVSEVAGSSNNKVTVKLEDTLASKPMTITLDLLVLMSGMIANKSNDNMLESLSIKMGDDGFVNIESPITDIGKTNIQGVFAAGSILGPKTLPEVIGESASVAFAIDKYLKKNKK